MTRLITTRIAAAAFAAAAVIAACQGAPTGPAATPPAGAVVISAINNQFEQPVVNAPAGTAFTIWFDNRENVPHNARIADATGTTVGDTEIFSGPAARSVEMPALAPGTYAVICDVHPGMETDLVAD